MSCNYPQQSQESDFINPSSEKVSWVFQVEGSRLQLLLSPNRALLASGPMSAVGHLTSPFLWKRGTVTLVGSTLCHWSFIFFPKRVCVSMRVWAFLASLPKEVHAALHFLPKGPSLGMHLSIQRSYGFGSVWAEAYTSLNPLFLLIKWLQGM